MTAPFSPSIARRPSRDGLRQKQFSLSRPPVAGSSTPSFEAIGGAAPDCVFKRFPAIGDTTLLSSNAKSRA
ncbi:conserved hypothetical protein [Burkholderiales bacterium 8X]|nr:conserved hypothetical protein [Burkholderiales bacterium 8X]